MVNFRTSSAVKGPHIQIINLTMKQMIKPTWRRLTKIQTILWPSKNKHHRKFRFEPQWCANGRFSLYFWPLAENWMQFFIVKVSWKVCWSLVHVINATADVENFNGTQHCRADHIQSACWASPDSLKDIVWAKGCQIGIRWLHWELQSFIVIMNFDSMKFIKQWKNYSAFYC